MSLRFVRQALPENASELSPSQGAQLVAAGKTLDGRDRPLAERLAARGEGKPERWEVVDGKDRVRYDVWVLDGDSGTVFFAGETRVVGHIVQFGFTSEAFPDAWDELAAASDGPEIDFSNEEP